MPEEKVESVKGLALTADGNGAVFDVAAEELDTFLSGIFLHHFYYNLFQWVQLHGIILEIS